MYDLIDRRVDALGQGSRFALGAMRTWVATMGRRNCPASALGPAFARMGLIAALPDVHLAMALLNRDALERFEFAPVPHPRITEHEALLLGLWRDMAAGRRAIARDTLGLMVEEDSIDPILTAIHAVAVRLIALDMAPDGLLGSATEARP